MSTGEIKNNYIGSELCPRCEHKNRNLNIFDDGSWRCNDCMHSGMLICTDPFMEGRHTHAHCIEKYRDKITNEVVTNFDCDAERHGQESCPYIKKLNGVLE